MRHPGFISFQSGLILLLIFSIAGCGGSHNDVLLFGTSTKFALDISAAPENAGVPQLTVGYKRQEFVWMPLYVNAQESTYVPTGKNLTDGKYIGEDGAKDKDTYSVLASFGADFGAGTGEASGGLAQMFATGIAARKLAANDSVVKMFSVQPEGAGVDEAQVKKMLDELLTKKAKNKETLAKFLDDSHGKINLKKLKQISLKIPYDATWAENKWKDQTVKKFMDWLETKPAKTTNYFAENKEKL